ncbi:cobalamin-binding protein [Candidatus Nanohalobium constans]|uniref:Iron complex transport system substrate-binding protein n=1 Tax=Candidatus Nanohalobium constans TaxID=2565781 RepID=A0A5Q0UFN5_9ARCH|nr:cobalamin-binding protein [Candidatus Nanohalobium constans]QGA80408.1 iron complex transport system substrate-binding protein [Candidatus Nanohalobium constans]
MNIVSLAPSNTEILYEIGAGDQVVATTSLCDYPEKAREKPSIGGWTNPKISRIHEFQPDLVIASDDLQDEAVEKIQSEGYPVLQVKPHSLEEVYESIEEIGEAVDRGEEAEELIREMKSELDGISLEGSPRIYCEEWMDPPMASGNWIPDLIEKIGGEYFIEEGRSQKFNFGELQDFDPEYIFMHICGAGENLNTAQLTERKDWEEIEAVEKNQVYIIDDNLLNRPGPRLVEGAKRIKEKVS